VPCLESRLAPSVLDTLIFTLKSRDATIVHHALLTLSSLADPAPPAALAASLAAPRLLAPLLGLARSGVPGLRRAAAQAVANLATLDGVGGAIAAMRSSASHRAREAAEREPEDEGESGYGLVLF
jgi:hypothetical protein